MLSDSQFVRRLMEFARDHIPDSVVRRLRRVVDDPEFTPEQVRPAPPQQPPPPYQQSSTGSWQPHICDPFVHTATGAPCYSHTHDTRMHHKIRLIHPTCPLPGLHLPAAFRSRNVALP